MAAPNRRLGMKAVPPRSSTACTLALDEYALSAHTSRMVKFSAVVASSGANCGLSAPRQSVSSTAVTMLVRTPVIACSLTHSFLVRSLPHLWSYQRMNRQVVNPVESHAKSSSTAFRGRAEISTRPSGRGSFRDHGGSGARS